ncbi:alpha/beta hydrolase [Glycomyces sp. A-F 0318]|uniref:serine aminopeptidase domain-containing protein n=1 Tax=Glycomyces amatae TaxID=2881355 RepID=UPI001E4129BE|nr:alpha/beta hydrolase [Glycomyces amatae]MCD0443900.1 alpha/beta hydrolase [Glycomyces amatae]
MGFAEQVGPEAMVIDEYTEGTVFDLPFFIFQGDQDAITPPEPARRFYESVTAPHKEFALIADASHFAAYRRPEQFLDLLLTKVLPAVEPARQQH